MVRRSLTDKDEVMRMKVNMQVDGGSCMMAINETIREQLQLPFKEKRKSVLANGSIAEHDVAGPVEVKFKTEALFATPLCFPVLMNH